MALFILLTTAAYVIGSIPFGILLTKYGAGFDIRCVGSRNIGATNVFRSGHKTLAALTLLLDGLKGLIVPCFNHFYPVTLFFTDSPSSATFNTDLLFCAAAIAGHLYPLFLKFKGGKGVATTAFCVWFLCPLAGLGVTLIWLGTFLKTRMSALAALVATLSLPVISYFLQGFKLTVWSLVISTFIIIKHRENILRLQQGRERKL